MSSKSGYAAILRPTPCGAGSALRLFPRDGAGDMYGLSFVASLFWASATLRFASPIHLPTSSAKCADAADGPGLGICGGAGVRTTVSLQSPLVDPRKEPPSHMETGAFATRRKVSSFQRESRHANVLPQQCQGLLLSLHLRKRGGHGELIWPGIAHAIEGSNS